MKNAKRALVVAFVMNVLNCVRCVVVLFHAARNLIIETSLSYETNPATPKTGVSSHDILQASLQQMHTLQHEQIVYQSHIDFYVWIICLAWNLLLAGLLIFAISRIQKSN